MRRKQSNYPSSHDLPEISKDSSPLTFAIDGSGQSFSVSWHARAPKFEGDLDIYVWQPYAHPPTPEFAQIFMIDGADTRRRRVLILFRSTRSLAAYSKLYTQTCSIFLTSCLTTQWTATTEVTLSIIAVFKQLTAEIFEFLHGSEGLFAQISSMVRHLGRLSANAYCWSSLAKEILTNKNIGIRRA